jgi:hypothetical protein
MAKHHLAAPTPMKIQFSPDAEGWADVLTGVYRRIH